MTPPLPRGSALGGLEGRRRIRESVIALRGQVGTPAEGAFVVFEKFPTRLARAEREIL